MNEPTIEQPAKQKQSHKGYAPQIRKLAMDYPELSHSQIARKVGCDPTNVSQVLQRFLGKRSEDELRQFQQNKADIYDAFAMKFLESTTDKKIRNTSAAQSITAVAILHDKSALLRGQPTGINVTAVWDLVAALKAQQG